MSMVGLKSGDEECCVLGVGLPDECRQELQRGFADCTFCLNEAEMYEHAGEMCGASRSVVIFLYVPSIRKKPWLRASAAFSSSTVKVIGVDRHCTDALYDEALEAEFCGVLCADADSLAYRRAAMSVLAGELWFPRGYLSRLARVSVSASSASTLSGREADVLTLLSSGTTNQEIADRLFVSRETVRWHLRSIYSKLGVSDRSAACRLAKNTAVRLEPVSTRH